MGFFAAKHFYSVKRILKNSEPYDVPEIYKTGKTRFYKSKNLASPLSFGILRPAIVIPEGTEEKELHFVLLHEQTHIKDKDAVLKHPAVKEKLADCNARLGSGGRMLLRKSGTEPVVRVMVEAADERTCEAYIDEMMAVIQGEGLTV